MTETRRESLSALLDGEASEIEVHRLVREFRSDDTLAVSWSRYQHIRAAARPERSGGVLDPGQHQALLDRISESIEAEAAHASTAGAASLSQGKGILAGSLALAASLVVAVFIGVQQPGPADAPLASSPPESMSPLASSRPIAARTVSTAPVPQYSPDEAAAPELIELDEDKQRQLRAYLNQHDRMARMNANRQLVNYKETTGK